MIKQFFFQTLQFIARSAEVVEYLYTGSNECPVYDTKQSDC